MRTLRHPMLIFLNVTLGLIFALQSNSRAHGLFYEAQRSLMPLRYWGVPFLVLGFAFALLELGDPRPWPTRVLTLVGVTYWAAWIGMAALAAHHQPPVVSYAGCVLYIAATARHYEAFRKA